MALEVAHGRSIPEGGWTVEAVGAPEGVEVPRRAARFDARADELGYFSHDQTMAWGNEVRFKYALTGDYGLADFEQRSVWGSPSQGHLRIEYVYASSGSFFNLVIGGSPGASLRYADAVVEDGLPHQFSITFEESAPVVRLDGAIVEPSQVIIPWDGAEVQRSFYGLRVGTRSGGITSFPGALWDYEYVGASGAANSIRVPLDGTVEADASFGSLAIVDQIGTILWDEVPSTAPASPMVAPHADGYHVDAFGPAAGMVVARRGVRGPLTGNGNATRINWAPTSPGDGFEFEGTIWLTDDPVGLSPFGRQSTDYWNVVYEASGGISLRANNVQQLIAPAGTVAVGEIHHLRVFVSSFTLAMWVDGVEVARASGGYGISTTPAAHYIGARGSGYNWVPAVIWDVTFRDLASEANTGFWSLDSEKERPDYYVNTHPTSTVGDMLVDGTVLPVRIDATTPGSGVPIPEGPVVVSMEKTTAQAFTASSVVSFAAGADPYGWVSGSQATVPVAHLARIKVTGRIRATALAGADEVRLDLQESGAAIASQGLTLTTANAWRMFSITFTVAGAAGSVYRLLLASVAAGDTVEIDDTTATLTLYPDLS